MVMQFQKQRLLLNLPIALILFQQYALQPRKVEE
jgi:hypothetical protein